MDLSKISSADWFYFAANFPDAQAYLLRCSLLGELEDLNHFEPNKLNEWQRKRKAELEYLILSK